MDDLFIDDTDNLYLSQGKHRIVEAKTEKIIFKYSKKGKSLGKVSKNELREKKEGNKKFKEKLIV